MTVWTAIVTSQVFAITLRILLSIGLGALIGLERQLRARSAGIRTNALVSLGSCLFTTVGVYTLAAGTGDPTRVAAQVASGIGFLGAGVILKQGVSVSGLNWTSPKGTQAPGNVCPIPFVPIIGFTNAALSWADKFPKISKAENKRIVFFMISCFYIYFDKKA